LLTTRARKFYNVLVENLGEEVSAPPDRMWLDRLFVRGIDLTANKHHASSMAAIRHRSAWAWERCLHPPTESLLGLSESQRLFLTGQALARIFWRASIATYGAVGR
jgi:hypothetical protein